MHPSLVGLTLYVVSVALTMKLLLTLSLAVQLWWEHDTRSVMMQLDAACIGGFVQFGFPVVKEWWKHNPRSVEESESVKLLWDFTNTTDRTIHANRPDLILVLKNERRAYLVHFHVLLTIM